MRRASFFSLFFLFVVVAGLFAVSNVGAVSYYNWVHNASFESYVNLIEDSSFESGLENQGQVYGNWSLGDEAYFSLAQARTGVRSTKSEVLDDGQVWYNFTSPVLGADVVSFSTYAYCTGGGNEFSCRVYYSDATYDSDNFVDAGSVWLLEDGLIDIIDGAKYVVAFCFDAVTSYDYYFDDVVFSVDLTGSGEAQDSVGALTTPWFNLDFASAFGGWFDTDSDLSTDNFYTGEQSYEVVDGSFLPLYQYMGTYLDASTVHYVDCWVYTEDSIGCVVNVTLVYTDGRVYYNSEVCTVTDSWVHLNFGQGWFSDSGYIGAVVVDVWGSDGVDGDSTFLDDVGIWSSVPKDFSFFEWEVSPNPLSYGGASFTQYEGVACTFYGYVYDDDGLLTDEGTYTVTDSFGTYGGVISNGVFHFSIGKRWFSEDTSEHFDIVIVLDSGEVLNVGFTAYWIDTGSSGDGDSLENTFYSLLPVVVVFFACCGVSVWLIGKYGILIGLPLASFLCYGFFPSVFPIEGVFAMIVGEAVLFILAAKGAF